jgi:transcriptional regulator with XRE-family HTH domain
MKNSLRTELDHISEEWEFLELYKAMSVAKWVREMKREYDLSHEDVAEYLDLKSSRTKVNQILAGSYPYSLETFARIEAMNIKLLTLKPALSKIDKPQE